MSNIFGILHTGVSGLLTSQAGIDVTGHNIANANTEGYSRQRVVIQTQNPLLVSPGPFGRGSKVTYIERTYDQVVAGNLRNESSGMHYWESLQTSLESTNIYFNELETGSGLGDALKEYFNSWQDLANTAPDNTDEASVKRIQLVNKTETLTQKINEGYEWIESRRVDSDSKITQYVNEINDLAINIADINRQIGKIESLGDKANDFRDRRELLLNKMAEYANINISERPDGQIAVYLGGDTLVDSSQVNKLFVVENETDNNHLNIYWGSSVTGKPEVDITDHISGGKIAGEFKIRDEFLKDYEKKLDNLAQTLITSTNMLHSTGLGLERITSVTSSNGVINPSFRFNETAGKLPFDINNGTFRIAVYNSEGEVADYYDIDIDIKSDSMNSLITKISAADGNTSGGHIQAYLGENGAIKITAEEGYTLSFVEDTTNFLVASGLNSFFNGQSAKDISLNEFIKTNPNFIASAKSTAPGDNTNALKIANLKFEKLTNNISIDEFYSVFVSKIASDKNQADIFYDTKKQAVDQLGIKLEQIKGVSIDEEFTNLIRFQKAYEANARFITAVDQMIDRLINGMGVVGR